MGWSRREEKRWVLGELKRVPYPWLAPLIRRVLGPGAGRFWREVLRLREEHPYWEEFVPAFWQARLRAPRRFWEDMEVLLEAKAQLEEIRRLRPRLLGYELSVLWLESQPEWIWAQLGLRGPDQEAFLAAARALHQRGGLGEGFHLSPWGPVYDLPLEPAWRRSSLLPRPNLVARTEQALKGLLERVLGEMGFAREVIFAERFRWFWKDSLPYFLSRVYPTWPEDPFWRRLVELWEAGRPWEAVGEALLPLPEGAGAILEALEEEVEALDFIDPPFPYRKRRNREGRPSRGLYPTGLYPAPEGPPYRRMVMAAWADLEPLGPEPLTPEAHARLWEEEARALGLEVKALADPLGRVQVFAYLEASTPLEAFLSQVEAVMDRLYGPADRPAWPPSAEGQVP